ncbi:NlpC/P60 family protein [Embleya sp. NPDC050154]|uniref:C40 family peptidase n=1 Tax=Embleya sp. NPDC050154 TaxID=3363988 RepID=UPI0037BDACBA
MASHRRPRAGKTRVTVLTATAVTAVAFASNVSYADPAPSQEQVRQRIGELYHQAEATTEEYNGLAERQERLREQVARAQGRIADAQAELVVLQGDLGSMAAARYRGGGVDPTLALLMSENPDEYLSRASALDRLAERQQAAVVRARSTRRTLDQERREAADTLAALEAGRRDLAAKRADVESKLTRARELLNTLDASDRARFLAADGPAEGSAGAFADGIDPNRASRDEARTGSARDARTAPLDGRAAIAVAAATRALGKPYVWGAGGPDSFDCSGLTGWAWRQAGVVLPRTSQAQAGAGRAVPIAEIRPGDLVVYFGGYTHVGVYVGAGRIIHAPKPGTNVRYAPLRSMPIAKVVRPA